MILFVGAVGLVVLMIALQLHCGTQYAEDFSLEQLERVEIGMTKQQVLDLLGEPLEVIKEPDDPEEGLIYAHQHPKWPEADYWLIRVQIDKDGKVVEVRRSYCPD